MLIELNGLLGGWLRWLRLRRAAAWALRGFAAGLGLSLGLVLFMLARAVLLRGEFLVLVASLSLGSMALAACLAFLWPLTSLEAARTYDRACGLQERVSTALEVSRMERVADAQIARLQLADTLAAARPVRVSKALPLRLRPLEGLLALLFVLSLGLVWYRGESWFQAAQQARAVQAAIDQQAAELEELLARVEADPALSPEQVETLSQPLQQALGALEGNPSLEGSVSALVSSGEALQALSDPGAQSLAEALRAAGETLAAEPGSPLEGVGEALASGDTLAAALDLAQIDTTSLSPAEAQQVASQLNAMAQALAASDPELAAQLEGAAQALQSGDAAGAQAALDQAASSLADAGGQVHFSQVAQELSGQVESGAGQLLASGGGDQLAPGGSSAAGSPEDGGGAGSGSGPPAGDAPSTGPAAGDEPIPGDNPPGDGGERAYESIYAPELLGGDGGPSVALPGGGEDGTLVGEGPSQPGEPGTSLVPYDQAYPVYEQFNRQAIEQGEIPFQFIPIIRAYFDSLTP